MRGFEVYFILKRLACRAVARRRRVLSPPEGAGIFDGPEIYLCRSKREFSHDCIDLQLTLILIYCIVNNIYFVFRRLRWVIPIGRIVPAQWQVDMRSSPPPLTGDAT